MAVKIRGDSVLSGGDRRLLETKASSKRPANKILLADTHPGLWKKNSSLKGARGIQGKIELCDFWERARRRATNTWVESFSGTTHGCHLSLV